MIILTKVCQRSAYIVCASIIPTERKNIEFVESDYCLKRCETEAIPTM